LSAQFYRLEPEVAGGFGRKTKIDFSTIPPRVVALHYEFEGWLGDCLVESHPVYLIRREVADRLAQMGASGYSLRPVRITKSHRFRQMHPHVRLPAFAWLSVDGEAGRDDFGLDEFHLLVISGRVMTLLMSHGLTYALREEWPRRAGTVDPAALQELKERLRRKHRPPS
jgi:hypothetical protein